MVVCALAPFALLVKLVRAGLAGLAMTLLSLLGGCFVILIYASGKPFGIDPVLAISLALLFVLPALIGGGAGALLGWLLRKRDDRR
jgi:hypothetical protein